MRLILRSGVPVVPVGVDGTYRAWPRWSSKPWKPLRRFTVKVRFGEPMHFGAMTDRGQREAALPGAEEALRREILRLSGEAARDAELPAGTEAR